MARELRIYQQECCTEICRAYYKADRVLISLGTGLGKSTIGSYMAKVWPEICGEHKRPDRVLWLAHRDELIWQAVETLELMLGERVAVEKGENRAKDTAETYNRRVVVSSVQTMLRKNRRAAHSPTEYGLCILDECAHAVADCFTEVLEYFYAAKHLGLTATPERADQISLGKIYQEVAYDYPLIDAIRDGWLAPIIQEYVEVELDWSTIRENSRDLNQEDLEKIIGQESVLHSIVAGAVPIMGDRQTIAFFPNVASAQAGAEMFRRYGKSANCAHGGTTQDLRRDMVDDFREGKFQVFCNCGIFLEGTDFPLTSCAIIARPTKSQLLYTQMIGRIVRGGPLCPIPGKAHRDALVIDLVGASLHHKLIHSVDLLGGVFDECVVNEAEKQLNLARGGGQVPNVLSALLAAASKADELRAEERRTIIAEAKLKRKTIDPFVILADSMNLPERKLPEWWGTVPATADQVASLKLAGINAENSLTFNEAKQLMDELKRRRKDGICTYKQSRMLRARGFAPTMTMEQASAVMEYMARRKGGFGFVIEDAKRLGVAKKRGQGFEYAELGSSFPSLAVRAGEVCLVRKASESQWAPITTKKLNLYQQPARRDGEKIIFTRGKGDEMWELKADPWQVINLRSNAPLAEKPADPVPVERATADEAFR